MKEWWWTTQLMADGHVFRGTEWRCADCRLRVFDLLIDRPPCQSPNSDDEFVFVDGPLDGEWRRASSIVLKVPMPTGPPIAMDEVTFDEVTDEVSGFTYVTYERSRLLVQRPRKLMFRYEFRG